MKITITGKEKAFDDTAAWRVIGQILKKPNSVIGLSTGRTTGNMHRTIADIYKRNPFDVSCVTIFGQDEITNVPREYFGACYTMLKTELIDDLGIAPENFLMLPTQSDDFEAACRQFTGELEARGGIDLLILGLGENGHLGFNQPGSPFEGTAWVAKMNPELEARVRRETMLYGEPEGITLGLKDIMNARRLVLVAKGDNKARIVKQIIEGPITPDVPASILQLHPDCEYLLDSKAAALLSNLN